MAKGVVRKIDRLGRVVIPKEYRKVLNITSNDKIEIELSDDSIRLKKYNIKDSFYKYMNMFSKTIFSIYSNDAFFYNGEKLYLYNDKKINVKMQLNNSIIYVESKTIINDILLENYYCIPIIEDDNLLGNVFIKTQKSSLEKIIFISKFFIN